MNLAANALPYSGWYYGYLPHPLALGRLALPLLCMDTQYTRQYGRVSVLC